MIIENNLFKKIIHVFVGAALIQGANIVLYMILARLMPTNDFATYRQLFLIQSIFVAISFSAIPTALLYFCDSSKRLNIKWAYVKSTLLFIVAIGLAVSFILFFGSAMIAKIFANPALEGSLKIFAIVPMSMMFVSLLSSVFIVIEKTAIQVKTAAVIALIKVVPVIGVAYAGGGFSAIVWSTTLANLFVGVLALCLLLYFGYAYKLRLKILKTFISKLVVYSLPLLLASSASILGMKIDHIIVSGLLGSAVYALYTVGAFEIPIFNLIQNSTSAVLIPKVTSDIKNGHYHAAEELWRLASQKSAVISFPLAALFIVEAEFIITLLFGAKYSDASGIFALFSALVLLRVISFGLGLRALGRTAVEFKCTLLYLLSSLLGGYVFTQQFGVYGTASWLVINTMLYALLISFVTAVVSKYQLRIWRVYPFGYAAFTGLVVLALFSLQEILPLDGVYSFIASVLIICTVWLSGAYILHERINQKVY